jgi:membrane-bound lytic murein transglycosylase MltF
MAIEQIENLIRYVTNADGKTTDVIVPVEIWQQLINSVDVDVDVDTDSGLAWVDEQEPKAQILADLQESLQQVATGQTFPLSQLWQDINT